MENSNPAIKSEFTTSQRVIVKYQKKLFSGYIVQRAYDPDSKIWLYKANINSDDPDAVAARCFLPSQHFVSDRQ